MHFSLLFPASSQSHPPTDLPGQAEGDGGPEARNRAVRRPAKPRASGGHGGSDVRDESRRRAAYLTSPDSLPPADGHLNDAERDLPQGTHGCLRAFLLMFYRSLGVASLRQPLGPHGRGALLPCPGRPARPRSLLVTEGDRSPLAAAARLLLPAGPVRGRGRGRQRQGGTGGRSVS